MDRRFLEWGAAHLPCVRALFLKLLPAYEGVVAFLLVSSLISRVAEIATGSKTSACTSWLVSLRFRFDDEDIFYWQDKSRREVDFVIRRGRDRVDVVECKINPDKLDAKPLEAFRELYPQGKNYLVSPAVKAPYRVRRGNLVFTVCSTGDLPE